MKKIKHWLSGLKAEFGKLTFPSRKETMSGVAVVASCCAGMAILVLCLDLFFGAAWQGVLSIAGLLFG